MNKVIRDGKVAVLYSPGFGAGWSTWADVEHEQFALFDPKLVELAEIKASKESVDEYIKETAGIEHFYTGGWKNIQIMWLPLGTVFEVTEYDGSETVEILSNKTFNIA